MIIINQGVKQMKKDALSYIGELKNILEDLCYDDLRLFLQIIFDTYTRGHQIFIFGNGGSAATALHFTCDINKGLAKGSRKRFKVICLNENISTITAYANDMAFEDIFVEQLKNFLQKGDLVIGISSSGTPKMFLSLLLTQIKREQLHLGLRDLMAGSSKN